MAKKAKKAVHEVKQVIAEIELITIQTARHRLAELKKEAHNLEAALDQREADVIAKLKAGVPVDGSHTATIDSRTGPSRPSWKDEYVKHFETEHGETKTAIEARVQKLYPGKPLETLVIGIKLA